MHVVGGVPLWVVCVFRRVDVVCLCLLCTQLLFCVRCFVLSVVCGCLLMFVSDTIGDHMVEAYSSMAVLLWFVCCEDRFLLFSPYC